MSPGLPGDTRRLFAHYDAPDELAESAPTLVLSRVMEEGDSQDLRWLIDRYSEARIGDWLDRQGHRQLSRRSLSFWRLILDRDDTTIPEDADELWLI